MVGFALSLYGPLYAQFFKRILKTDLQKIKIFINWKTEIKFCLSICFHILICFYAKWVQIDKKIERRLEIKNLRKFSSTKTLYLPYILHHVFSLNKSGKGLIVYVYFIFLLPVPILFLNFHGIYLVTRGTKRNSHVTREPAWPNTNDMSKSSRTKESHVSSCTWVS